MNFDLMSIIISILSVVISSIALVKKIIETYTCRNVNCELKLDLRNTKTTQEYIHKVNTFIKEMYPKTENSIQVFIIEKGSNLSKLYTYNSLSQSYESDYKSISDVPDVSEIKHEQYHFYFITNTKEYYSRDSFNISKFDYDKWNTRIISPICKKNDWEKPIGYLCIYSTKVFSNMKKNKRIIKELKRTSINIYNSLSEEISSNSIYPIKVIENQQNNSNNGCIQKTNN